ncbi:MAG: putative metal-dependent hydrolase [Leptospiraceae bacterium]|nr:putative metal-dependent hydrolase [Leptospiraceae bacterium]
MSNLIGMHKEPEHWNDSVISDLISELENFPKRLSDFIGNSSEDKLNTKTSPNVWTVRQIIHHLADSHMNAFIRTKLALTEDVPIIKPYKDNLWGDFPDANKAPVQESLLILKSLHSRWCLTLRSLNDEQWKKEFYHPERKRKVNMLANLSLYAWHGKHHMAYIEELYTKNNW